MPALLYQDNDDDIFPAKKWLHFLKKNIFYSAHKNILFYRLTFLYYVASLN